MMDFTLSKHSLGGGESGAPEVENVVIIGSGPSGLTAALYTARAGLNPLVLTGNELGGQVSLTNEVENYPGFPEGATGPELVEKFQKQAERFGARIEFDYVTEVDFGGSPPTAPFIIRTYSREIKAKSVIVTTGASHRHLDVPGEKELTGRGVSYCGTCDAPFFRDKDVVVVGGGDSAIEEGLFLAKFAKSVNVVHRRDQLRAGPTLEARAMGSEKMRFTWDTVVTSINGENSVESVTLKNVKTGEESTVKTDGVFIFVGHVPNSDVFRGKLEMDVKGYLKIDARHQTSVPGVFAAGEIADSVFRQLVTSAGDGCKAALSAQRYLEEIEGRAYPGRKE